MAGQPQQNDLPQGGTNPGPCTPGTGDPSLCSPSCGGPVNRQCPWTYCTLYTAPDGTRQPTTCRPAIPAGGPLDLGMGQGGGNVGSGGGGTTPNTTGCIQGELGCDFQVRPMKDNGFSPFFQSQCRRLTMGGQVECVPGYYWDRPTQSAYQVGTGPQAGNPNPTGNTGLPPPNFPLPPTGQLPPLEGIAIVEPDNNLNVSVPQDALSAMQLPELQSDASAIAMGVNSQINFAGDAYLSTQASLGQSVVNALLAINDTLTGIESTLDGRIGIALDAAATAVNSAGAKIGKAVDNAIGTTYGYAAQLGVSPPTADDFAAIGASIPISCGGNPTTTPGGHGIIPTYIVADPGALPELPFSLQQNNTRAYEPNLGTESCPCGVIEKDTTGNGDWKWYRIPGSICPAGGTDAKKGNSGDGPPIVDITPDPGGGGGGGGRIQNHTVIGCEVVDATHVNQILDDGSRVLIQVPDAAAFCRGGYGGGNNNAGGGGLLNNNPVGGGGGNISVVIGGNPAGGGGGTILNNPSGNNVINVSLCPPASSQCGGGGSGRLVTDGGSQPDNPTVPAGGGSDGQIVHPFSPAAVQYRDSAYPNWNTLVPCQDFTATTSSLTAGGNSVSLATQFGLDCNGHKAPALLQGLFNALPDSIATGLCQFIGGGLDAIQHIVERLVSSQHCRPDQVVASAVNKIIFGVVNAFTAGSLTPFLTAYTQQVQSACPQRIPSVGEANHARLAGTIGQDLWRCWVQANGVADVPEYQVLLSQRTRPGVSDVIKQWLRGDIDDVAADTALQQLGVIQNADRAAFFSLSRYVRDAATVLSQQIELVDDDPFNDRYGIADKFSAAFTDDVSDAVRVSGFDKDAARRQYYSDIKMPSVEAIMDGYRRLSNTATVTDTPITIEDVDRISSRLPYPQWWLDRAKKLSYNQLGFRQDGMLYGFNIIDDAELLRLFKQQGWSDEDSSLLLRAYRVRLAPQRAKYKGHMSEAEALSLYTADGITHQVAHDELVANGYDSEVADRILSNEDRKYEARIKAQLVTDLKSKFVKGEISQGEAITALVQNGVEPGRASYRVSFWVQEVHSSPKLPPLAALCDWYTAGLITIEQYAEKARNLGWSNADALNYVMMCDGAAKAKLAKKALADASRASKQAAAAAKAAAPCRPRTKPLCPAPAANGASRTTGS